MDAKREKELAVEINVIYMMSLAMDLILRDAERRIRADGDRFRRETKQTFTRFVQAVKTACILQEDLTQDIYREDEKYNYRNVDVWLGEANELARLMLLFADRSTCEETVDEIFKAIRNLPGEGIVTDEMLDNFRLKKL